MNKEKWGGSMFKVLREININPGINQRTLAKKTDISIGKINSLVDELENEKYITRKINGREHKYYISEKGLLYLEKELGNKENTYLQLHTKDDIKPTEAVILSAGKSKSFDIPVSLLQIDEEKIIERTIRQLKDIGIKKIVVVVGYKAEQFKDVVDEDIIIVENPNYKWSGTMESLSKAAPYIENDFILIEGDVVLENSGLIELVKFGKRDCMLITTESGSGDEGFVEIKDKHIFKIAKDIAQLNRIDGEMIGVSKLSYELYIKMLEAFKNNKNPYMNYEYMILDISRKYSLGYVKIDNLLWHEIDTVDHLEFVKTKLLKRIVKKEESSKLSNLSQIVSEVMNVSLEEINSIEPIGGMTNKNYKVVIGDESFVLRVPGNGTEDMISRKEEIKVAKYATEIGVDAELIYFNEDTGIKVSRFIENAETLTAEAAKKQENMKLVCDILRKLHNYKKEMSNVFDVYEKIDMYERLLIEVNGTNYDDYFEVKEKVIELKEMLTKLDCKLAPCHNDTLAANFIKSSDEKMYLIDWEYGGMNDPMWDLAAYSLENEFLEDEEELFLNIYFGSEPDEKYRKRILINKIYQDFLWSIWTKVKEASGDDFGDYGIDRYNRAKSNLELLFREKGRIK